MKVIDFLNLLGKLLVIVVILVPTGAFALGSDFSHKLALTALLYAIVLERIWFSLFTTKEGKSQKSTTSDWSLILVTYTYLLFLCALYCDLFQGRHQSSWLAGIIGTSLMVISYVIRSWSVAHLSEQWASHLEVTDNVGRFLVRSGPYSCMRHPIYTAAIVEFIGMQFLFGGIYSWIFLISVGIPSVIFRSLYEEKVSRAVFGDDYCKYMAETGRFFPNIKTILTSQVKTLEGNSE